MTATAESIGPQEDFLAIFKKEPYRAQFSGLGLSNHRSVAIHFSDIVEQNSDLARQLLEKPAEFLVHAGSAAIEQFRIEDPENADGELKVRVYNLFETTSLRNIGSNHIGKLIMLSGIVVRATVGKPKAVNAAFKCRRCNNVTFIQQDNISVILRIPLECENPDCHKRGPFEFVEEETTFINEQEIWVQETPDELPPGQLPRSLHLKLIGDDLVDVARPGDDALIVGIVRSLPKRIGKSTTLSTFDVFIEVNSVKVLGKEPEAIADPADISRIEELAKDPWVHQKIVASIAPSIFGYETIKEAVMYLLFGGVPKEREDIKIRGELNILLIGDPGTAKSQLLRYVAHLAPRGLFTSGKGTTGVGLTAAVIKDQTSGEYMLEAGALVLADKGTACIDELDKMHEADRETIHETLEQHTVSIAKGGIVATLNARASVLAAANPVLGRYNVFTTVVENINLPVTLLSRFDLIFLMRDVPDEAKDTELSTHILGLHAGSSHYAPVVESQLLRKYIGYARQLTPVLSPESLQIIQKFYLQMRKASEVEGSPLAIGPRQLEALTRISEARARAALRQQVTAEDAEGAIRITMESMKQVGIDLSSGKPDIDILLTGKPKGTRDKMQHVISAVVELAKDTGMIETDYLVKQLREEKGIQEDDSRKMIARLLKDGTLFEPREGYLKKT